MRTFTFKCLLLYIPLIFFILIANINGFEENISDKDDPDNFTSESQILNEPLVEEPIENVMPTFNEFQAKITEQKNRNTAEKNSENHENGINGKNDSHDSTHPDQAVENTKRIDETEKLKDFIHPNSSPEIDKKLLIRKNVADTSCGAKLLDSNPKAKYPHHILNDNLDEYMNQPCSSDKWFVIEICEPIMIQAIQIANLEMFSSRFKTFKVFVSDRYPAKTWIPIGLFQAQDQRSLQLFKLRDDHLIKFVRFEIIDHYGTEHFCPITLVKIFGLITDEIDDLQEIIPIILPPGVVEPKIEVDKPKKPLDVSEENIPGGKNIAKDPNPTKSKKEHSDSSSKQDSNNHEIKTGSKSDIPSNPDKTGPKDGIIDVTGTDVSPDNGNTITSNTMTITNNNNNGNNQTSQNPPVKPEEIKIKEHSNFFYKATQYFVNLIRGTFLTSEPKTESSENIQIRMEDIDQINLAPDELMVIEYLLYMQHSAFEHPNSNTSILTWSNDLNSCVQSLQKILINYGHLTFHYRQSNQPNIPNNHQKHQKSSLSSNDNVGGEDVGKNQLPLSMFNTPLISYQSCSHALDYFDIDDITHNIQRGNFLIRMLAGYRNITRVKNEIFGPKKINKPVALTPLSAYQLAKIIIKYSNRDSMKPISEPDSPSLSMLNNDTSHTDDNEASDHFADEYVVPSGSILGIRKETAFMRITNRIRQMEENVSVSMHYLEELSQNYRIQTEKLAKNSEWMQIAYARLEKIDAELNSRIDYLMNKIEIIERRLITGYTGQMNHFVPLDPWSHRSLTLLDRFFAPNFSNQLYLNNSIGNFSFLNASNIDRHSFTHFNQQGNQEWLPYYYINLIYGACQQVWDTMMSHQYRNCSNTINEPFYSSSDHAWYRYSSRMKSLRKKSPSHYKEEEKKLTKFIHDKIKEYLMSLNKTIPTPNDAKENFPFTTFSFQILCEIILITIVFHVIVYFFYLRLRFQDLEERTESLKIAENKLEEKLKIIQELLHKSGGLYNQENHSTEDSNDFEILDLIRPEN